MFATAHNANILNANERVYFRFDNHGIDTHGNNRNTGNLKVAVLTNKFHGKQRIVRCYSISDRSNSDGLRFSTRERNRLVEEIIQQNPELNAEDLSFEQYKVCVHGKGKSQGEAIATVFEAIREKDLEGRDRFAEYSASEISLLRHIECNRLMVINAPAPRSVFTIREIRRMQLDQDQLVQLNGLVNFAQVAPGQQGIDGFMEMLASNQRQNVERGIHREILPYITRIYRNYKQALENHIQNRNQKFESHGFLLGFLANLSHRYTIGIDLDLSLGSSYAAFLVRRQAERENIPIVINFATLEVLSGTALNRARGYAKRLHVSSFIPTHTESRYAVCVGLNFNLNLDHFSVDTIGLQWDRFPLVQKLFECVENEEIRGNIRDFLLHHLPSEIPMNVENYNRIFNCITGFAFGDSAFTREYLELREGENQARLKKYIFRYDDENHALTMVFHAQGSNIIILHIRAHDAQQQGNIDLQTLNVNGDNVHVWEVSCTLSNQLELDIDLPNDLGLYHDYQADDFLGGNLVQVPNAENVHNALNQVMNDGWQDRAQHQELFTSISMVLMPENMDGNMIIDVNSKDKFRSMLHGIFYACDDTAKVITRYRVGQEQRFITITGGEPAHQVRSGTTELKLDLLLLRGHPNDTHPIGYTLKLAGNQGEVQQEQIRVEQEIKSLMKKQRGYKSLTSGNDVVLSSAVFNNGAQGAEDLISIPQALYIHRLDRSTRGLAGPDSVIDENPPEELLSDITRKRLIDYFQSNQKQSSIPLLDLGNNRWVAVRYLEGSKELVIRRLTGTDKTPTAQEIRRRIRNILGNQGIEVNDLLTLEFATENQFYGYWLQQIDIVRAARLQYGLTTEENHTFEVVNLAANSEQMTSVLNQFMENAEQQRLTLIITLNNTHWVTLVIERQNENYVGYYANSSGGIVPNNITDIIENVLGNNVAINNVSIAQQTDSHNCGLWALENARDINQVLDANLEEQGQGVLDEMHNFLTLNVPGLNNVDGNNLRNEEYFKGLRRDISQLFKDNPQSPAAQFTTYIENREQIDPLLRRYLELGYYSAGGGCELVKAPISLDFSNPQSALDEIDGVSRVYDHSKCKSGR